MITSFALGREKKLPIIPVEVSASGTIVERTEPWAVHSSDAMMHADTYKTLPIINVESTLPDEETRRLHELWNGAGLSARAHRRRRRENLGSRRIPPPISIPEPDNIPPTLLVPSADPSITSSTTPTTGTRKRWGFLSARQFSEAEGTERKSPSALEKLRAMAQDRLKKKLRYAKSAPNLGDQAKPLREAVAVQSAIPVPVKATSSDKGGIYPRKFTPSSCKLATPGAVPQQEDMNENAIYFTIDPNWCASQGNVRFEPITPVPHSPTCSGRPDSPLLHRHYSLDQLSYAAQQVTKALAPMEFPEVYPSPHGGVHPIDELHAYLEF